MAKKWLKLKQLSKTHICGIRGLRVKDKMFFNRSRLWYEYSYFTIAFCILIYPFLYYSLYKKWSFPLILSKCVEIRSFIKVRNTTFFGLYHDSNAVLTTVRAERGGIFRNSKLNNHKSLMEYKTTNVSMW